MRKDMGGGKNMGCHISIDTDAIHEQVHRSVNEAMEGLHAALEDVQDLQFQLDREMGELFRWGHADDRESTRANRAAARQERAAQRADRAERSENDVTHAVLRALERGDISVNEAMEQLG